MKQVKQDIRSGKTSVSSVPAPTAKKNFVVVRTVRSLISAGTERATVSTAKKSLLAKAAARPDQVRKVIEAARREGVSETLNMVTSRLEKPTALGYSASGIVVAVGRDVAHVSVGDRVSCAGQDYASHAEYISVPKNLVCKLPDGLDFEAGAFGTLGAIALQGIRQAAPAFGETVAVVGLGLLGLLTVQMLKANGCQVVATDLDREKVKIAEALSPGVVGTDNAGLGPAIAAATSGRGADAVILTASAKSNKPVELAADVVRKRGVVVAVGDVGMDLPREPFFLKEVDFRLSTSYGPGRYDPHYEEGGRDYPYAYVRWTEQRNIEAFLGACKKGQVKVEPLISHRYAIEDATQAYDMIVTNSEPYLGVLLTYPEAIEGDEQTALERSRLIVADPTPVSAEGDLRLGVIGLGNHVRDRLLGPLKKTPNLSFAGVCTNSPLSAEAGAASLAARLATTDYHVLLEDDDVDAVLIGTRHDSHTRIVADALAAGRHVFVEKPLCLTEQELEEIDQARAKHGNAVLMVGFNRRFSAHARKLKDAFARRNAPIVMSYRVNAGHIPVDHWIQDPAIGGGRLIGEGCHFIDFMTYICGALPVSVSATALGNHPSGLVDDHAVVELTFADGSVGTLVYAAGGDKGMAKERFEAFGAGISAEMDDFRATRVYAAGKIEKFKSQGQDKGFTAEIQNFVAAVRGHQPAGMRYEEIRGVSLASILAQDSLRSRQRYPIG